MSKLPDDLRPTRSLEQREWLQDKDLISQGWGPSPFSPCSWSDCEKLLWVSTREGACHRIISFIVPCLCQEWEESPPGLARGRQGGQPWGLVRDLPVGQDRWFTRHIPLMASHQHEGTSDLSSLCHHNLSKTSSPSPSGDTWVAGPSRTWEEMVYILNIPFLTIKANVNSAQNLPGRVLAP